jgi:lipopolysaccharide transport system permease protein
MSSNKGVMSEQADWDLVIEPQTSLFALNFRELWRYRDLLFLLVKRDFISFYKQTILGPLWFFIQPIFTTVTYTLVFGNLANISTQGIPKPLFYMTGIVAWNYFSECLIKTSTVFKDNTNIFGKVYFPRQIMPLSIVASNLIRFMVQALLLFVMMGFFALRGASFHLTVYGFLFPVLVLEMALLGLGTGMIISALTTKYRDLAYLVQFGIQLLMYTTTVVYPLSSVPARFRLIIALNPMTPIIETFRYGFLGEGSFTWASLGTSLTITLFITLFGIFIFNKVERNFIDSV